MNKSYLLWLVILSLTSCQNDAEPAGSAPETQNEYIVLSQDQREIAGIKTGEAEKHLMADLIDCTGFVDVPPTNIATVHAPIAGIIRSIEAIPGMKVNKGEVLATLTDKSVAEMKENYLSQQSEMNYLKTELARKEKLFKQEAISKREYLKAQNEYNLAVFRYQALKEELQLVGVSPETVEKDGISSSIQLTAPFDGYISDVFVNTGAYIEANHPLIEVINYDHIHLALSVYSNAIGKVEIGQSVRFKIAGSEKGGWANVQLIGKKVDEESKSILVHAHIDSVDIDLTIGTSVMAELLVNADSSYCLPEEAIITQGGRSFVYLEMEDGFIRKQVQTGRIFDGRVEILNDEEIQGKQVVTRGAYYLSD
jgi:membrane fusion protein, heavy metal efflux system